MHKKEKVKEKKIHKLFILVFTGLKDCVKSESESEVAQSCPTLCNPMDCSRPSSSVHGIFQAIVLEWVAISFSKRLCNPANQQDLCPLCLQMALVGNWSVASRLTGEYQALFSSSSTCEVIQYTSLRPEYRVRFHIYKKCRSQSYFWPKKVKY